MLYSTYGGQIVYIETQVVYDEQIAYNKGQIVYIQEYYQPHEIVKQKIFTHPDLRICPYFSLCRNGDIPKIK